MPLLGNSVYWILQMSAVASFRKIEVGNWYLWRPLSMYVSTVLQSNKASHLTITTICFDVNTSGVSILLRVMLHSVITFPSFWNAAPFICYFFFSFTRITFNNCKYFWSNSQLPANAVSIALCLILQSVSHTVAIHLISLLAMGMVHFENNQHLSLFFFNSSSNFILWKKEDIPCPTQFPTSQDSPCFFPSDLTHT